MTATLSPQAILKARFSELANVVDVHLLVRRQGNKFYFTVRGLWSRIDEFLRGSVPRAWMTSCSGAPEPQISEYVYALPPEDVERIVSECRVDPAWLELNDSTARKVAEGVREERAFDRLPILADALEEAGCDHAAILEHCRAGSPHGRTCWAIDLLLGPDRRRK